VTPQGGSGYLFVVKGDQCFIHSRDALRRVRAEVAITDADGDGYFIYPADRIACMKYVDGWVAFEAGHDEGEDRYWVRYETEGGAKQERSSYDPRLMQALDEELEKTGEEHTFPAALLREGISVTKSYLAKAADSRVDDHFKTLQLFDKSKKEWESGDGHLFAADNIRACYFYCEAFCGKGLAIHGQHLPALATFLSKCEGDVTIKLGEGVTFVIDAKGRALGWSHHVKQHGKFSYYSYKMDKFLLRTPKDLLVKTLRYVRTELDSRRDKIRIQYEHEDKSLRFQASEASGKTSSAPVGIEPVKDDHGSGGDGDSKDFAANANINYLLDLVEPMKGHQVDLRAAVVPAAQGRREMVLFRTTEEFWLSASGKVLISKDDSKEEAYLCRVTRFMPSKD
jgi:hypothetical protein